jgi:hypothetical protein
VYNISREQNPSKNRRINNIMSEKVKNKIGEELYNQILKAGLKAEDFDLVNDGSYIPRARLNEAIGKLKATEEKVTAYEKQLNDTKTMLEGSEEYKTKYDTLLETHKKDLELKDKEIINTSKKFLIEQKLNAAGGKHTDYLMTDIDLDKLTIDNNNIVGLDPIIEDLKVKRADMFAVTNNINKNNNNNNNNNDNNDNNDNKYGGDIEGVSWDEVFKDL